MQLFYIAGVSNSFWPRGQIGQNVTSRGLFKSMGSERASWLGNMDFEIYTYTFFIRKKLIRK